jgi:molybdopterin converting factor small subunit
VAATITVRYWAGAQRAAGVEQETLSADTIADLRATLAARAGFDRLASVVSFLVDGQYAGETERPPEGAVVDVLPPFAGGC